MHRSRACRADSIDRRRCRRFSVVSGIQPASKPVYERITLVTVPDHLPIETVGLDDLTEGWPEGDSGAKSAEYGTLWAGSLRTAVLLVPSGRNPLRAQLHSESASSELWRNSIRDAGYGAYRPTAQAVKFGVMMDAQNANL